MYASDTKLFEQRSFYSCHCREFQITNLYGTRNRVDRVHTIDREFNRACNVIIGPEHISSAANHCHVKFVKCMRTHQKKHTYRFPNTVTRKASARPVQFLRPCQLVYRGISRSDESTALSSFAFMS